jgi:outer membrane protein TolC
MRIFPLATLAMTIVACVGAGNPQSATVPAFAALSLTDAESKSVARDVTVAQAQAAVMQSAANLHLADVLSVPHLLGDYSLSPQASAYWPPTAPATCATQPSACTTVEQHLLGIGAGIVLNDFFAQSDVVRASANDLLAAQREVQAAILAARENAVRLYFNALSAIALARFRQEELSATLRDRSAARLRAGSGESPKLDVIRADVAVQQARADLALAKAQVTDAVQALAIVTGVSASTLQNVVQRPAPSPFALSVGDAVTRALAARPEIASLLASIQAREANVDIARQSGLPAVTAQGGYESAVDTGLPVRGPSVAVHLDLPVASPEGSQVKIAQAQLESAQWQLVGVRRAITLEVSAAVRDATAADQSARAAAAASNAATQALHAVELGYREGVSSSLDVTDTRLTYVQASVNALAAEYARDEAHALLEVLVP